MQYPEPLTLVGGNGMQVLLYSFGDGLKGVMPFAEMELSSLCVHCSYLST